MIANRMIMRAEAFEAECKRLQKENEELREEARSALAESFSFLISTEGAAEEFQNALNRLRERVKRIASREEGGKNVKGE